MHQCLKSLNWPEIFSYHTPRWAFFHPLRPHQIFNLPSTWQSFKCPKVFNMVLPSEHISKMNDLSCFKCISQEMISNAFHGRCLLRLSQFSRLSLQEAHSHVNTTFLFTVTRKTNTFLLPCSFLLVLVNETQALISFVWSQLVTISY